MESNFSLTQVCLKRTSTRMIRGKIISESMSAKKKCKNQTVEMNFRVKIHNHLHLYLLLPRRESYNSSSSYNQCHRHPSNPLPKVASQCHRLPIALHCKSKMTLTNMNMYVPPTFIHPDLSEKPWQQTHVVRSTSGSFSRPPPSF